MIFSEQSKLFLPIPGVEGYSINPHGILLNNKTGYKSFGCIHYDGYWWIYINDSAFYIHRLVAITHIPNPENKPCVNHLDGDKLNPFASNLEWATQKENAIHSVNVLGNRGSKPIRKIVRIDQFGNEIIFNSVREAGRVTDVAFQGIQKVLSGVRKTSAGYFWEYAA